MSESDGNRSAKVLPENTRLHDQYVVTAILGTGSFGVTYRAHDELVDATVAIKEYFPRQLAKRAQDGGRTSEARDSTILFPR